ncbi:MarR family winged helix-turn-helix transcriptional regulator [Paenibacillus harenae]|uniref:DNA-binding MarR family transcriptional regulator n=1 Tax=Paenibacillus harenae TaxID=306543 RepID=A0ABT9U4K7_PAEHA|nr:MarR family transcriptional regulator [Paenibacillus harenae]MDQ0061381.1 DNA-binding MarR family transcriptional regulator [Paenibacillus harenae]MDQ0113981.1 DNA-binding MarR family transcriptional regulator [Paenibacillus harenae]
MQKEQVLLLRDTVQQFIRSFGLLEQTTTPCGFSMSLSQVFAIQELEKQSLTITELAEKLRLERSSVSRLVDGLVKGGFVSRELNENNRREVIVELTEKGTNTIRRVRDQSVQFYNEILENLSETEQMMFYEGIQRFTDSLMRVRGEQYESSPRT